MLNRLARVQKLGIVLLPAVALGCATTGAATPAPSSSATVDPKTFDLGASKHVAVEMPAVRDRERPHCGFPGRLPFRFRRPCRHRFLFRHGLP